jgi:hypothetical protein
MIYLRQVNHFKFSLRFCEISNMNLRSPSRETEKYLSKMSYLFPLTRKGGENVKKILSLVLIGILVLSVYMPIASSGGEMVPLIFEYNNKDALINVIEAAGGEITVEFATVELIAATVPLLSMGDVLGSPYVETAWKDRPMELPRIPEGSEYDDFTPEKGANLSEFSVEPYDVQGLEALPEDYYNYMVTGAEDVWRDPDVLYGNGTLVAVIDTGTYPGHPCFLRPDGTSRVIGGISFAPNEPSDSWGDPDNHYHGTVCGGIIASNCAVIWPETDLWAQAVMEYAPPESWYRDPDYPGYVVIPLLGMAPLAELYAIKVFPKDGSSIPSSIVMQGIDHAIYQRELYDSTNGAEGYPIDVISMSLGGGTGFDGNDPEDRLVDKATRSGIVVSVAAGNSGPAFNTVETPGCANTSISVGAAVDPVHIRVGCDIMYDWPGVGWYLFPYDDTQVIYFSSRGTTSDGRLAPDVLTNGVYTMAPWPPYYVGIMSGTSSACPAVSGGAALLVAWQKANEGAANPFQIRNAILEGAVPLDLPYPAFAQGHGYFNVPNALALLQSGIDDGLHLHSGYSFDVTDLKGGSGTWSTGEVGPGLSFNIAIDVGEDTEKIDICLSNVTFSGPQNPLAGDNIEFYVQSGVRTYDDLYFNNVNVYDDCCFTISNPIPGTMRIVIEGHWWNWGAVSCDVTVTETIGDGGHGGHKETIGNDEWHQYNIDVPAGLSSAIFELWWQHDWAQWPTYDLDMYIIDPYGNIYFDGATFRSPETTTIPTPMPGTYIVLIYAYDVYHGRDPYMLNVYFVE